VVFDFGEGRMRAHQEAGEARFGKEGDGVLKGDPP